MFDRWKRYAIISALIGIASSPYAWAQTREQKVRADRTKFELDDFWIYNNLPKAFQQAKVSGKPILAVFRCIPCEECVKLDDDVVEANPQLQQLLKQFVRVRVISNNGLDLSTFQFDTDQSFAVMMLRSDGTIYGRYGTRSDRTRWEEDVSVEGLAEALRGVLELHADFPKYEAALQAKRGKPLAFATPEKFPSLRDRYQSELAKERDIADSCIHCHQVGDAIRDEYFQRESTIPTEVLFSYPHPKSIGLILDPKRRANVLRVVEGSIAAKSGLKPDDAIQTMAGQPIVSMADVQWVLQQVNDTGGNVSIQVQRDAKIEELSIDLPSGWRKLENLSWRASTWELRRMALGGLYLVEASRDERAKSGIPSDQMLLKVEHVGEYAPHDLAKKAGVQKGDFLIGYAGKNSLMRETDVIRQGIQEMKRGDMVELQVLRGSEKRKCEFRLP